MPNSNPYVTTSILTYEHCCSRKYYNTYEIRHAAQAKKKKSYLSANTTKEKYTLGPKS